MTFEPALHLHFEVSNDCTQCCPRILHCCCCSSEKDSDKYIVKKNKKLKPVPTATKKVRKKANKRMFEQMIPEQIGVETWDDIKGRVTKISGIDIDEEKKKGKPITKRKLIAIGQAIDEIMLDYKTSTGTSQIEEESYSSSSGTREIEATTL